MIQLTKSDASQTISFIPRYYKENASYTVKLTSNDELNVVFNQTSNQFTAVDYYYQYSNTFNLDLDTRYELKIMEGNNLIYQDVVLCTDQTTNYSINKNVFVYKSENEDNTDNQFILY